jgi:hypothetical protein
VRIDRTDEKLARFLTEDTREFSVNAAKSFADVCGKYGIEDARDWFAQKFQLTKYLYEPNLMPSGDAECDLYCREVYFSCPAAAEDKKVRAHEMGHIVSSDIEQNRCGLGGYALGTALNEGVTELFAEILTGGKKDDGVYSAETAWARILAGIMPGELFEGYLFDPKILADKFNTLSGDKNAYTKFLQAADKYLFTRREMGKYKMSNGADKTLRQMGDLLDTHQNTAGDLLHSLSS